MTRPIHEIASEIRADWRKPYFGAVPYIEAWIALAESRPDVKFWGLHSVMACKHPAPGTRPAAVGGQRPVVRVPRPEHRDASARGMASGVNRRRPSYKWLSVPGADWR